MNRISPLIGRSSNCSFAALLALLVWASLVSATDARAQNGREAYLQAGVGVLPGVGLEGGYIAPRGFFTLEGVLYVDGSPQFAGGEGSVQVAGGLGGAIRLFGIMRAIGSPGYAGRDFDVGLRVGPSLFFTVGESSRDENPFSLFLEPFLRASSTFGGERIFFGEIGIQRPFLRVGVWFDL